MASESFRKLMASMDEAKEIRESLSQHLEGVRQLMATLDDRYPLPEDVTVTPVDAGGVPAEWVTAPSSRSERVLLYTHGGCYISGSPVTVRECCARLAIASDCKVLSVDYRLAPEHPFPAALDDVLLAYDWLLQSGYEANNIIIGGESAGGGLTIATLMKIRDDGRLPMPALGIPISPWIDMTMQHESLKRNVGRDIASTVPLEIGAKLYVADGDPQNPYVSPLFGELNGLPPLLIQVGGGEVLLDDGIAISHKARQAGVDVTLEVWPDMCHVWHWMASELDEGDEAIKAIGAFIKTRLK
ncbi:MAG: alpha/beta hydrolase [Pseudomonadota bacterium]